MRIDERANEEAGLGEPIGGRQLRQPPDPGSNVNSSHGRAI
jgi:hypothetical protein